MLTQKQIIHTPSYFQTLDLVSAKIEFARAIEKLVREQVLEEAAKVCEEGWCGRGHAANAIRAMKSKSFAE